MNTIKIKKEVLDDFTYYEYVDDECKIDNVGLNILKQNFLNIESKKVLQINKIGVIFYKTMNIHLKLLIVQLMIIKCW